MSRISFDQVWDNYYGRGSFNVKKCPLCTTAIHKSTQSLYKKRSWERSHIFPVSKGGRDVLPNVIPLCTTCNRKMADNDLYSYLEKKMDVDASASRSRRSRLIDDFITNSLTCSYSGCCRNIFLNDTIYCSIHDKKLNDSMMEYDMNHPELDLYLS